MVLKKKQSKRHQSKRHQTKRQHSKRRQSKRQQSKKRQSKRHQTKRQQSKRQHIRRVKKNKKIKGGFQIPQISIIPPDRGDLGLKQMLKNTIGLPPNIEL
jgi:sortase (surface protein transpeptidase)